MEREVVNFWLDILDFIFSLNLYFIVIAFGFQIIRWRVISGLKILFIDFLSISFFVAVLGHFLANMPVEFLFRRYILEGYKLLPILYYELIEPIFKVLWPS